jgi:hypothetical protein
MVHRAMWTLKSWFLPRGMGGSSKVSSGLLAGHALEHQDTFHLRIHEPDKELKEREAAFCFGEEAGTFIRIRLPLPQQRRNQRP